MGTGNAATAAAIEQWKAKKAATPIDDEAWERHLEWREKMTRRA
jgi:hypothetical protein